jgi:hypothetical protein
MYYIGEISYEPNAPGGVLIELWDGGSYRYPIQAKRKIEEIEKEYGNCHLQIIDDKKYDMGWE